MKDTAPPTSRSSTIKLGNRGQIPDNKPFLHYVSDVSILAITVAVLYLAYSVRSHYLHKILQDSLNCDDCLNSTIYYHDSNMFASLIFLTILSLMTRRFYAYVVLRLLVFIGFIFYIADIATIVQFFTRLRISDVLQYGDKLDLIWRHVSSTGMFTPSYITFSIGGALLAGLVLFFPPRLHPNFKWSAVFLLLPISAIIIGQNIARPSYVHEWAVKNVITTNLKPSVSVKYSEEFRRNILSQPEAHHVCETGLNQKPNIVLLILESWSAYHSELLSGINNWTPILDKYAKENTYFENNIAAGFTTNEGLMALLAGNDFLAPIKDFFSVYMYEATWDLSRTAPKVMNEAGYYNSFFTSGNLEFVHKGDWLNNLGFDLINGHNNPHYKDIPRMHFDSVPDHILYEAVLEYLGNYQNPEPSFTVVETVSTHHPYIHPKTKKRSEEAVFRYMDESAGTFVAELFQKGYFENGILIITSDHRAMTPITPSERDTIGFEAPSKVPLIIIGQEQAPKVVKTTVHQADLIASLENLISDKSCRDPRYQSWFKLDHDSKRCVFHAQGADRNLVDVICSSGTGVIKLNGDETHFSSINGLSPEDQKKALTILNSDRIKRDIRHEQYLESLGKL